MQNLDTKVVAGACICVMLAIGVGFAYKKSSSVEGELEVMKKHIDEMGKIITQQQEIIMKHEQFISQLATNFKEKHSGITQQNYPRQDVPQSQSQNSPTLSHPQRKQPPAKPPSTTHLTERKIQSKPQSIPEEEETEWPEQEYPGEEFDEELGKELQSSGTIMDACEGDSCPVPQSKSIKLKKKYH